MSTTASPISAPVPAVIATDSDDAHAVDVVRAHHAELAGALNAFAGAVLTAVRAGSPTPTITPPVQAARTRLLGFLTDELLPHAAAEEDVLYPAAARLDTARLLVEAMIGEHRVIQGLVDGLAKAASGADIAATTGALVSVFDSHLTKENDLILPLLAADPGTRLAAILEGMHELLGHDEHAEEGAQTGGCGGHCGCGETDAGVPVLDATAIPHAIRHATVLGAFDALAPGAAMDLLAPHNPLPLLHQLSERNDGRLGVEYLQEGPDVWRLRLTRA